MKRIFLFLLLMISSIPAFGQQGLRVMSAEELSLRADVIVRGKVKKVEKANYLATYSQLVTLQVGEVIKGDSRLSEVMVWGNSRVIHAADAFAKNDEVLIFLVREQTFYRTLNYQHGRFFVEGDTVKSWRVTLGGPPAAPPNGGGNGTQTNPALSEPVAQSAELVYGVIDKSYGEVRREVETYLRETAKVNEGEK
ncbi:MAG: hypothetical protein AB1489_03180 [Acidobacteriota bacterium]